MILQEWIKIFRIRKMATYFLVSLFVVGVFYVYVQYRDNKIFFKDNEAYQSLIYQVANKSTEMAYNNLQLEIDFYEFTEQVKNISEVDPVITNVIIEEWKENHPEIELGSYEGEIHSIEDLMRYKHMIKDIEYLYGYPQFVIDIITNDRLASTRLFSNKSAYPRQNIDKTKSDFEDLEVDLFYEPSDFVTSVVNSNIDQIIMIIFILILAMEIFSADEQKGFDSLQLAAMFGRKRLQFNKIVLYIAHTILLVVSMKLLLWFLSAYFYKVNDLSQPIQSIYLFKTCADKLSIFQYMIASLMTEIVVFTALALVMALIIKVFKTPITSFFVMTVIGIISVLLYYYIPSYEYHLNFLKYINFYYLVKTDNIFTDYQNINFFGKAVGLWIGSMYISVTVSIGMVILYFRRLPSVHLKGFNKIYNLIHHLKQKISKIYGVNSIFSHELRKILIINGGLVWLILLGIFMVQNIDDSYTVYDKDMTVYRSYIERWGGIITDKKSEEIAQEAMYFNEIENTVAQLTGMLEENEISDEDYEKEMFINQLALEKRPSFNKILNQVNNLEVIYALYGIEGQLINEYIFNAWLGIDDIGGLRLNGFVTMVAIVFLTGAMYSYDGKYQMDRLIITTAYGRKFLMKRRLMVSFLLSFMIIGAEYGINLYNLFVKHPTDGAMSPIQSLEVFSQVSLPFSILGFSVLMYSIRLLVVFLMANITIYISMKSKHPIVANIISLGILLILSVTMLLDGSPIWTEVIFVPIVLFLNSGGRYLPFIFTGTLLVANISIIGLFRFIVSKQR